METAAEIIRVSGPYSIKITKVKVRRRQKVSKGTIFCIYTTKGKQNQKWKSDTVGLISEVFIEEGQELQPGEKLVCVEGCSHPTVMKDMCADCGADLRIENSSAGDRKGEVSASVAMVHNIPELIVSEKLAHELGKADEERLLKTRKLVLLVDLDQTLIHTTNDNIPSNLKDVHHYQMWHGNHLLWYHTRLRPHTHTFLQNISRLFELHICTFGARMYAHTIAKILDPEGKYFSTRILSRDECFNATSKTANLKALFPCGDGMVCIIDDREDVWNFSPNLVHVKPYRFFQGTADINAPPGLAKTEHDEEPIVHRERRVSQSSNSSQDSSDKRRQLRAGSVDTQAGQAEDRECKTDTQTDEPSRVDNTQGTDSEMVGDGENVSDTNGTVDKPQVDSGDEMEVDGHTDKSDESDLNCVKDHHKDVVEKQSVQDISKSTDVTDCENDRLHVVEVPSEEKMEIDKGATEKEKVDLPSEQTVTKSEQHITGVTGTKKVDTTDTVNVKVEDKDTNGAGNAETTEDLDQKMGGGDTKQEDDDSGGGGDKASDVAENDRLHVVEVPSEEKMEIDKGATEKGKVDLPSEQTVKKSEQHITGVTGTKKVDTTDTVNVKVEDKDTNGAGNAETTEDLDQKMGGGDIKQEDDDSGGGGDKASDVAEVEEEWLEWDDEDDYLFYLEESLVKIHTVFYDIHDQHKDKECNVTEKPSLKNIIPYIKRKILKGCNIVFSGVIPTNMQTDKHRAYTVATALGATVQDSFLPKTADDENATTHMIAARSGTSKVRSALKHKACSIVTVDWLWSCSERWERVEESLFPLSEDTDSKSKCVSPDVSKMSKKETGCKRKSDDTDITDENSGQDGKRQKRDSMKSETMDNSLGNIDSSGNNSKPSAPAAEDKFALSYNPLYLFSDEDMEVMDKEIEDMLEEDNDSSEDDTARDSRLRDRVLTSRRDSSSEESLSGNMPRGWGMSKKLSPKSSSSDDDSKVGSPQHEQQLPQEYESETEMDRFEKTLEAFAPDSEDSDSYQESIGSVDDELADAVEKEFLSQ